MALKEYRDKEGHTFQYDEDDKTRPESLELVEVKAVAKPANKATDKPGDTK
jgi:hypothetical protein